MTKVTKYKELLSKSYKEAVEILLEKYGPVKNDYFNEVSYNNFLENRNNKPGRPENTETPEGLYSHHIDEIEYTNLSDKDTLKREKYSFDFQKKDRLVYCDLFEHAILHVLIAKETLFKYGFLGYKNWILNTIDKWYLKKIEPDKDSDKKYYEKAYLDPEEASMMVDLMSEVLEEYYKDRKEKIHNSGHVEDFKSKFFKKMMS